VVGVVGDGAVGTIFLRVTDAAASGVALTVLPATRDGFTTGLATAESSVAFTAGSAIIRVDRAASVVTADLPTRVAPETGLEITTAPWPMPVAVTGVLPNIANGTGSVSSGPRAVLGTAPVRAMPVGARAPRATANAGWREDVARGVIVLDLPGRAAPVTVATGLATIAPDEWCAGPRYRTYLRLEDVGIAGATFGVGVGGVLDWVTPDRAGCVDWAAIGRDGLTVSKETVMQFRLAGVAPGALLWVVDGDRQGELYEVDAVGTATYVGAEAFAANQAHYREVWGNVIPVGTAQVEDLAGRGMVAR
jgi:hypothetical protein